MSAARLGLAAAPAVTLAILSACATHGPQHASPSVEAAPKTPPAAAAPAAPAPAAPMPAAPMPAAPTSPSEPAAPPPQPAPAQEPTQTKEPAPAPPAEQTAEALAQTSTAKQLPPCMPVRKPHHRRKVHPKEPQGPEQPGPIEPPGEVDAQVGEVGTSLSSILGKNVEGPKGESLGRVVDLLADAEGHVRVAVIDFGGFLGVGTRRIAVDWPLLHFNPKSRDKPLVLSVTRAKLQTAPQYKDSTSPQVLMPPPAEASQNAADTGEATK